MTFAEAAALTLRRHPEILAAEARARAAGLATTVPLIGNSEWRGRNETIGVMLDPVALLGFGPRGAEIELADARVRRAVTELAVARWRTVAEVAEAYRLHRVFQRLRAPALEDADLSDAPFARAGLASPVAAAALQAANAGAAAERAALDRLCQDQLSRIRHLLALPPHAALTPIHDDTPTLPDAPSLSELLDRPDLTLAVARFEVADAELRRAVAAQYPSLQIGPSMSLRGDPLRAMGMLKIPLLMHGAAAAAQERRAAARHDVEDALLEARLEAETAESARRVAGAVEARARAVLEARSAALRAAQTALAVEPEAFSGYAAAAREYVEAVSNYREAASTFAVADVRRAVAYGWPRQPATEDAL